MPIIVLVLPKYLVKKEEIGLQPTVAEGLLGAVAKLKPYYQGLRVGFFRKTFDRPTGLLVAANGKRSCTM